MAVKSVCCLNDSKITTLPPAAGAALSDVQLALHLLLVSPEVPTHSADHRRTEMVYLYRKHAGQMHSHSRNGRIHHCHVATWQLLTKKMTNGTKLNGSHKDNDRKHGKVLNNVN